MPLYEYQCKKCGHRFERIQKFSDPTPACPKCKGEVEQLLHAPAVQFKGSGWYVTDYARGSSASSSSEDGKSSTEKTENKADSKPETKKEAEPKGKSSRKRKD